MPTDALPENRWKPTFWCWLTHRKQIVTWRAFKVGCEHVTASETWERLHCTVCHHDGWRRFVYTD